MEIECPARCPHYQKHEAYQRERLGAEFRRAWLAHTERFYEEERFELLDFMVYLEVLIYQYYRERTAGRDEEILEALELVRRELSDLVMIVESATTPLGRHLLEGVEVYLEERELDRKAALEGVEATIDFLKRFSGDEGGRNPRRYLQGLMGHVAQDLKPPEPEEEEVEEEVEGEGEGIITPRIITPEEFRRELEQREWG